MRKVMKACIVALLAVSAGLAAPGVASAASEGPSPSPSASEAPSPSPSASEPQFGCLGDTDKYGAPLPCQLTVTLLSPICDNDVPKLRYAVDPVGTPNTTVTITWLNPSGPDVVQSGLPLTGTVLWPGAVVGPDGKGADWPGWTQLPDGTWVEGDEFDWVRPSVSVLFEVNPSATMSVAYPPSSPACLTNPPGSSEVLAAAGGQVLSATGSNSGPVALVALALVVAGGLAVTTVAVSRRRRVAGTATTSHDEPGATS